MKNVSNIKKTEIIRKVSNFQHRWTLTLSKSICLDMGLSHHDEVVVNYNPQTKEIRIKKLVV